jgi:hypothetical protein
MSCAPSGGGTACEFSFIGAKEEFTVAVAREPDAGAQGGSESMGLAGGRAGQAEVVLEVTW